MWIQPQVGKNEKYIHAGCKFRDPNLSIWMCKWLGYLSNLTLSIYYIIGEAEHNLPKFEETLSEETNPEFIEHSFFL